MAPTGGDSLMHVSDSRFFDHAEWHARIEPVPPTVEAQNLNHWTTREVLSPQLKTEVRVVSFLLLFSCH